MPKALKDIPATFSEAEVTNFWEGVDTHRGGNHCWPWQRARKESGHGRFYTELKKLVYTHRYVYTLTYGEIPEGMDVHHSCDNPWCCNPKHVEAKTKADHGRISSLHRHTSMEHKYLGRTLADLAEEQLALLKYVGGDDLGPTKKNIGLYSYALIDEICELAKEIGVKEWKPRSIPDREKLASEFADILAFVGTLAYFVMEYADITPQDIEQAYKDKVLENLRRFLGQREGYWIDHMDEADIVLLDPRERDI